MTIPNKLAQAIRETRLRKGMTQQEYLGHLDFKRVGYISKIERGSLQKLDEEFFSKLSKELGRSVETLKTWWRSPPDSEGSPGTRRTSAQDLRELTLGFGHSIWGAPIVIAACNGWLMNEKSGELRVKAGSLLDAEDQLSFISVRQSGVSQLKMPGEFPRWPEQERAKSKGASDLRPASAADLLKLLKNDTIDIAVVPKQLLEHQDGVLDVGPIVDSTSGAVLVCPAESEMAKRFTGGAVPGKARAVSTLEFGSYLLAEDRNCRIGAERGTVAVDYVMHSLRVAASRELATDSLEDVIWNLRAAELRRKPWEELQKDFDRFIAASREGERPVRTKNDRKSMPEPELCGFVVWEPHATWMQKQSSGLIKFPLYFAYNDRPPFGELAQTHMSFNVFIAREKSEDYSIRRALPDLMYQLWKAAEVLETLQRGRDCEELTWIAQYFGLVDMEREMTPEGDFLTPNARKRVREALHTTRYCVYMNMGNANEFATDR